MLRGDILSERLEGEAIAAVLAVEATRVRAMLEADVATLEALTADEYTHIESSGGTRNKAEFLATVARPDYRFEIFQIDANQVRVYGDTAVVTGSYHNAIRTPAGLQPVKHARHIRVYVRRDGRWRNVAHQATAVKQA